MKAVFALYVCVFFLSGCDAQEPPTGMPRCEPEGELIVERSLKNGFRHLYEGDSQKAREVFTELLADEPEHPEALLGRKLADGVAAQRGGVANDARLIVANRLIPAPMPVNSERFRYEFEREGQRVRDRIRGRAVANRKSPYSPRRDRAGAKVASNDLAQLQRVIDAIVFRDSQTHSAVDFFYASATEGASTHFLIDAEGLIHQTLDLAFEAHHCNVPTVSRRSISITLVNPMHTSEQNHHARVRSAPLMRHGVKISQWAYTPAQRRSLNQLVAGLLALFPQLKVEIPEDELGRILSGPVSEPAEATGLLGHFHLDGNALDPTVAFPWSELKRYLSVSLEP